MKDWFHLSPFVSDLRLSFLWLILSNIFPCTVSQTNNIENSVMSNTDTRTIFFSVYFFIFNRETKHEKLRLTFSLALMLMCVRKKKLNHISRPPPPPSDCCFTPSKFFPCTQKNLPSKFGSFFHSATISPKNSP